MDILARKIRKSGIFGCLNRCNSPTRPILEGAGGWELQFHPDTGGGGDDRLVFMKGNGKILRK